MILLKFFYALALALGLLDLATGGVAPLWAQQPQVAPWWAQQPQDAQGPTTRPGGTFSDGLRLAPVIPGGPPQPIPSQVIPGTSPVVRSVARQCAAEASWQQAPAAPAPLPGASPQLVSPQPLPLPQQQPRTQGVGSISAQALSALIPPQQLLAPGIDPTRTGPPRQREAVAQLQELAGVRADQTQWQAGAPGGLVPLVQELLSPIEHMFGDLRQFGYAVFSSQVSTFAPVDDVPVGPDYILGPGDSMVIHVLGLVENEILQTVDRNGRILLPKVGLVRVWGLTFSQADRLIREELARYFRGFSSTVTMGRLRTIRVHVVGEVCQPGSYTVSSLSTVTNALFAAGGPTRLGSLRDIRLRRNGHHVGMLDLYDFLLKGDRTQDFRLESGDTIFIPTIGSVVGIQGEVKRPAIYELREAMRASDLILMAGGVTPRSYLKRVQVIRQQPSAERTAIDIDLTNVFIDGDRSSDLELQNGDLMRVSPSDHRIYNVVHLAGAVKYPGDYELKSEMRISQLLAREKLLPEAHLERVEIVRRRPDLSMEIIAVDLKQAWAGNQTQDLVLKPLDEVAVRTELRFGGVVTLEGEFKRPGQYTISPGERLSSVIRRAGSFTDRAYVKGVVFTRAALKVIEQEQLNTFLRLEEQRLIAAAGEIAVVGVDKVEPTQHLGAIQARRELLRALASRVAVGRMVVRLDQPEKLENTPDDVILQDGDTLRVAEQPSSVLVVGSVRTSTSVQYKEGMSVDYYIGRVGGFTQEADQQQVHLVKADGSGVSGFSKIRSVEQGDTIVVPPKVEEKIRAVSLFRDALTMLSQTLLSVTSLIALAKVF